MELLTDELRAQLPPLYAQENEDDAMIYAKFFTPWTGWTWFVTEGSQEEDDFIFFGYVIGNIDEWGYFSLAELESIGGGLTLPVERDLYFEPGQWTEVIARFRTQCGE